MVCLELRQLHWTLASSAPERLGRVSPPESPELRRVKASLRWAFLCVPSSPVRDHKAPVLTQLSQRPFLLLTQVAGLNKRWKEFGAFSWVAFVSSGSTVNLASEGDYSVLSLLSFTEIKVCVCVWAYLSSHLSDFIPLCVVCRSLAHFCVQRGNHKKSGILF